MKDFVQDDKTTDYTCSGDVAAGSLVLIYSDAPDAYVGVAKSTGGNGDIIALTTRGKVRLGDAGVIPLSLTIPPVKGASAYWDGTNVTMDDDGGSNPRVGRFDRSEHNTSEIWLILNEGGYIEIVNN